MTFLTKRTIRLIKLCFVSVALEKIMLITFIFGIIILFVSREFITKDREILAKYSLTSALLEKSFSNVDSFDKFLNWSENDFYSLLINSSSSPFRLLGKIRLYQYRADIPEECFNLSTLSNETADLASSYFCNPLISSKTSQSPIPLPQNLSLCIEADCDEFKLSTSMHIADSDHLTYPTAAFEIFIDKSNIPKIIGLIKSNLWIDPIQTKAIVLEPVFIDPRTKGLIYFRFTLENIGYKLTNRKIYRNFISNNSAFDLGSAILYVLSFVSIFKTLYEMSLILRFSQIWEIVIAILQLCLGAISSWKGNRIQLIFPFGDTSTFDSCFAFNYLYKISEVENIEEYLLSFLCLFIPFRLFSLISWIGAAKYFIKYCSAIYRTIITLGILMLIQLVFTVCWGSIYYFLLRAYEPKFESYVQSLFSFLLMNVSLIISEDDYLSTSYYHNNIVYNFCYLILFAVKTIFWAVLISFLSEAYRRAGNIEFYQMTSSEIGRKKFLIDISRKIDKFVKENLPQGQEKEDRVLKNKMLVWFDSDKKIDAMFNKIYGQIIESQIKLMPFINANEMIQFIKWLFQLKPMLLQKSTSQFRMIFEIEEQSAKDEFGEIRVRCDTSKVEYLLSKIQEIGGKVPVLIFSRKHLDYENRLNLRQTYQNIYFSQMEEEVFAFSLFVPLEKIKFINAVSEHDQVILDADDSFNSQFENLANVVNFDEGV